MTNKLFLMTFALLGGMTAAVLAEEGKEVKFLAVGDAPISRIRLTKNTLKEKVAEEVEVDKQLLPPARLLYQGVKAKKEETEAVRMFLGVTTSALKLEPELGNLSLYLPASTSEGTPEIGKRYLGVKLNPKSPQELVYVYKGVGVKSWEVAKTLVVPNDWQKFPA